MAGQDGEPRRHGPIYDDAIRLVIADDVTAFLNALRRGGLPLPTALPTAAPTDELPDGRPDGPPGGTLPRPIGELPATTIRPDLLVQLPGRPQPTIVHVEVVKDRTSDLALRMVDYRLRTRAVHPRATILQAVLALTAAAIPDRYHDPDGCHTCRWQVIRITDLDPATLLTNPTTATLAALASTDPTTRPDTLAAAIRAITATAQPRRGRLLASALTLSSIVLPAATIERARQEADMPVPIRETPLARAFLEEGRTEGRVEGRVEGRTEGARRERHEWVRFTQSLLTEKFGADPRIPAIAAQLAALPHDRRAHLLHTATSLDELDHS